MKQGAILRQTGSFRKPPEGGEHNYRDYLKPNFEFSMASLCFAGSVKPFRIHHWKWWFNIGV
jgi:hypothetical protein